MWIFWGSCYSAYYNRLAKSCAKTSEDCSHGGFLPTSFKWLAKLTLQNLFTSCQLLKSLSVRGLPQYSHTLCIYNMQLTFSNQQEKTSVIIIVSILHLCYSAFSPTKLLKNLLSIFIIHFRTKQKPFVQYF